MPAAGRIGGWVAFRGGLVYVSNLLQENFYMLLPFVLNSNLYCINLRVYLATPLGKRDDGLADFRSLLDDALASGIEIAERCVSLK